MSSMDFIIIGFTYFFFGTFYIGIWTNHSESFKRMVNLTMYRGWNKGMSIIFFIIILFCWLPMFLIYHIVYHVLLRNIIWRWFKFCSNGFNFQKKEDDSGNLHC